MLKLMRLFLLLPMLMLASCQDVQVAQPKPLRFTQFPPIAMNVGTVNVVEEYRSSLQHPFVEHEFRTSPAEAMRVWVKDRIRTKGGTKRLEVIIKDASVKTDALPRTPGFRGMYTIDQKERYDARLEVEFRIYGDRALSEASVNVVATRSDTAAENFSPADRDALYDRMVHDLMALMNAELEKNFQMYFSQYIDYSPPM